VLLLGLLQRRRFEREVAAKGETLQGAAMLGAALRMAFAALLASGLGLLARAGLSHWLPDTHLLVVLLRAVLLCLFGISAYAGLAYLFGVRDLTELRDIVWRKLLHHQEPSETHHH
jgi:putative peptidoglycan lipid II flippase